MGYNIFKVVNLKKRLIWLLGIGLTLMIVPFIINKYSIFRVISLVIGVILIEVCFCLKKINRTKSTIKGKETSAKMIKNNCENDFLSIVERLISSSPLLSKSKYKL